MHTHVFGPNFQENFFFNQLFIYLYLQTKPIVVFYDIILHTDIVLLSRVTLLTHKHK